MSEARVPLFPSTEWMDSFCQRLVAHPRAAEAAAHLGGTYRFVVDPAGPLRDRHTYEMLLAVDVGGARAERITVTGTPRVTVRTDYGRWRELLEGRLDIGPAMLFGRLRISGDLGALLSSRHDVDVLVEALREVDTTWREER